MKPKGLDEINQIFDAINDQLHELGCLVTITKKDYEEEQGGDYQLLLKKYRRLQEEMHLENRRATMAVVHSIRRFLIDAYGAQ